MGEFLATDDVARLAGVGPSAVKRWADGGALPCQRTAGGHRRFRLADVQLFLRTRGAPPADDAGALVDLLLRDVDSREAEGWLLAARARRGAWHGVADAVGPALEALGQRWASGRIGIVDEHLASARLSRALARIGANVPVDPGALRAMLACAEGEEHTLGLSLADLCLREAGWNVLWAGRRTPLSDLRPFLRSRAVAMVALSASEYSSDAASLSRQAAELGPGCREAGVALVLGGSGAWPEAPPYGARLRSFEPFHRLAVELRLREEVRSPRA